MSRSTIARDVRIAALLRKAANELDPSTTSTAPVREEKVAKAAKAPEGGKSCLGCGKAMVHNPVCRSCAKKGAVVVTSTGTSQKVSRTEAAPKAAAKVAPEAPAKAVGRTAKAHCSTKACTKFGDNATGLCLEHRSTKGVQKAPEGAFLTLEDGKRGYRVPAKMVVALRKADLEDSEIIAAAKAKGLGHKVPKAAGVLAK